MKESTTYQAILEEGQAIGEARGEARGEAKGKLSEAKKLLRMQGESRFGPPDAQATKALARIVDLQHLEELGVKLLRVNSWHELLDLPAPRRGRRRPAP